MRASIVIFCAWLLPSAMQQPTRPTFHGSISLVPVAVTVLDEHGRPMAGLRQQDFAVRENGTLQPIESFSVDNFEADARASDSAVPQRRTFLIVFDRGRQVGPVDPADAAIQFVRDRLLPGDEVAVVAYTRVTSFSSDREKIVGTIDRYKQVHELIEQRLEQRLWGLNKDYGYSDLPENIQRAVDGIFRAPGALPSRTIYSAGLSARSRLPVGDLAGFGPHSVDKVVEGYFDRFATIGNLLAGVRYLSTVRGERHLVLLVPHALPLGDMSGDRTISALAQFANEARVAIDVIQTYGLVGPDPHRGWAGPRLPTIPMPSFGQLFLEREAIENASELSRLTGGETSAYVKGSVAFARIDAATRTEYLLGYRPVNALADGSYRDIDVTVDRPNVTVLFRHGYRAVATNSPPAADDTPVDRSRLSARTHNRFDAALELRVHLDDLDVSADHPTIAPSGGGLTVAANVRVGPRGVSLVKEGSAYIGRLEAEYVCGDTHEMILATRREALTLNLDARGYQRFVHEGLGMTPTLTVDGDPKYMKIVVYDPNADRVGSAVVDLARR